MRPFAATGKTTRNRINPDGRAMRQYEQEFEAAVVKALKRLRLDMVKGITADNVHSMLSRLDDRDVTRPFQDAIERQVERVALAGAEFGREQVERHVFGTVKAESDFEKSLDMGMWDLANNAAAEWASRYGYELVRGLLGTTRDWLQVQIAEYVRNSETIGQLIARIREGSGYSATRANMIAVTEVTRAFAAGNLAAWQASGVIEKRRWNTNNDELVCPVCGPLAGQVVGLDEEFGDGIDGPPAHPRCRCWITPVVE